MTDLLVDSNGIFARQWYSANGVPEVALTKCLNAAIDLINPTVMRSKIDRIMFCWDGARKNDKNRPDKPVGYDETRDYVKLLFAEVFGGRPVQIETEEADDLLATAAFKSTADKVIIASGDKDLHQLLDNKIAIFCLNHKAFLSRREITCKWGVKRPIQVAVALAIQGDKIDNIKGVRGYGEQKTRNLLEVITPDMELDQVVETIVANLDEVRAGQFIEALGLTLLNPSVADVPEPFPLKLTSELGGYEHTYPSLTHVWNQYGK